MEISQKLPVGSFKWIKNTSQFNKDFIENYNEITDEGYFLKVDVQCSESCMIFTMIYLFLPERMKIKKSENYVAKCMTKKNISYT